MLLTALAGSAAPGQDAQRWITDQLEVDLRRGQSTRHAITRMVPSGTAVQLLEEDAAAGYSRVRTPSGAEGWVLSRYLQRQPTARVRLPDIESRLAASQRQIDGSRAEAERLRQERDELRRQAEALQASAGGLQRDLAVIREASADTLRIQAENRSLTGRLASAEQRVGELEAANRELSGKSSRDWFLAGGGVLCGGLALGLVLPRIQWTRRRTSWNRL